jgi:hypothetical protein
MGDALGIGEVIDRATRHPPATRLVTTGAAVKAMVLNGLGCVNQPLSLGPRFFQDQPPSRLLAPLLIDAQPLHDEALGRALDALYNDGVTARYSLMAATAAERRGLAPRLAPRDRTSFHGDGRDNSDHAPDERVVHLTRGYRRDQRPDRQQGLLALLVEHPAGIPVLMKPLSGKSRDAPAFGPIVREHRAQLHTTYGTTSVVADRALSSEDHRQKLSETRLKWRTRVPAPLSEAQAPLAPADLPTRAPLLDGYRDRVVTSTSGGVAQRWGLISSEHRLPQAQRTVDKQGLKHRAQDVNACKQLCRTACACAADAQQARSTCAHGLQATFLAHRPVRSTPRDGQRGRPGADPQPDQVVDAIAGSFASRLAPRQARVDHQRCVLCATNELDETPLPPQERLEGDKSPGHAERGFRFLTEPRVLAASR